MGKWRYSSSSQRRNKRWRGMWLQECLCVCGEVLDPDLPAYDPDQPTLDHLFPHSLRRFHGQNITVVMHRGCNEAKDQREPNADELEFVVRMLERVPLMPPSVWECKEQVYAMLAARTQT